MTRKGKSHSKRPISKRSPVWLKYNPEEVEFFIVKLAKDGIPPSMIGIILRDQYGIPLVKTVIEKSIKEYLEEAGLKQEIPEDLNNLLKKANIVRRHIEKNKSDSRGKRALELIDSKIRRLMKYYQRKKALPENWDYKKEALVV